MFPRAGEVIVTGKKGRPTETGLPKFRNYLRPIPKHVIDFCEGNVNAIAALLGLFVAQKLTLDDDQRFRLSENRDGLAMDLLNGEPVQVAVNVRMLVFRKSGETLETAFLRRFPHVARTAQSEANETGKVLYAVPVRYCIARDCRTLKDAIAANLEDLTQELSGNICAVYITDDIETAYKGALPIAGEYHPEAVKKARAEASKPRKTLAKV